MFWVIGLGYWVGLGCELVRNYFNNSFRERRTQYTWNVPFVLQQIEKR